MLEESKAILHSAVDVGLRRDNLALEKDSELLALAEKTKTDCALSGSPISKMNVSPPFDLANQAIEKQLNGKKINAAVESSRNSCNTDPETDMQEMEEKNSSCIVQDQMFHIMKRRNDDLVACDGLADDVSRLESKSPGCASEGQADKDLINKSEKSDANDVATCENSIPNGNEFLDHSSELMIAEDDDNNEPSRSDSKPEDSQKDKIFFSLASSEELGEKMVSSDSINSNLNDERDKSSESVSEQEESSSKAEIKQLRNEVHVLQQQNTVHMQMIHYLVTQMNILRNQLNFNNSPPPNGFPINPLLHLMTSYGGANFSQSAPSAVASLAASYSAGNGFADPSANLLRKPCVDDSVKKESHLVHDTKNQPFSSILGLEKRFENNAHVPTTPSQNSSIAETAISGEELLLSSSSTPPTSSGQRSSPPDLQIEKPLKNQCVTCGKVLSCGSALKLHYRTHTGERPYACDMCARAFTTRGNLRTHYSSVHHRELPPAKSSTSSRASEKLSCSMCNFACENEAILRQHMQMHVVPDKNALALQQCIQQSALRFPYNSAVAKTMSQNSHDVLAAIQDPGSNGQLHDIGRNEKRLHEQRFAHRAGSCSFEKENFARKDMDDATSSALDLSTNTANKQFVSTNDKANVNELENNLAFLAANRSADGGKDFDMLSRTTNLSFPPLSKAAVNGVQALDSSHPRYNACRVCFRRFNRESELHEHLLTHDNVIEDYAVLRRAVENRASLKRSIEQEIQAEDAKRLKSWCKICKKQFSSASSLAIHTRTHTGEKPYSCSVCQRAFTTRGNLKVHMNIHEHGAGGTRRGRSASGSKKMPEIDISYGQGNIGNGLESNDTLAILQRYAAFARSFVNGTQGNGNDTNMTTSPWIEPMAVAQLLQQQQYLQNLAATDESPVAAESDESGDRQHTAPSSPENEHNATSEPSGVGQQKEVETEPSSETPNVVNKDWMLQMYQKTQGEVN